MDQEQFGIDSKVIHDFPPFTLVEDTVRLPDDNLAKRTFITHPGAVAVVAVNAAHEMALVRQYRYPIHQSTLEIPAGKLDRIDGETKESAARRELREETGLTCDVLVELGPIYPSPAITDELITVFYATELHTGEQDPDDDEFIEYLWMPVDEVKACIADGTINDGKTLCAVAMATFRGFI